jgi:hypothetical protein
VTHVSADGDEFTLECTAGRDSAAQLLANLMERKIPVAAFTPHAAGLEEAYLRHDIAQVD